MHDFYLGAKCMFDCQNIKHIVPCICTRHKNSTVSYRRPLKLDICKDALNFSEDTIIVENLTQEVQ